MNCPNCDTWNPDDKNVCWRCQAPLPRPEPKKEKRRWTLFGIPIWIVLLVVFFLLTPWISQCAAPLLGR